MNDFIDPQLTSRNLDKYHVRRGIWLGLKGLQPTLYGTVLDVGSGRCPYKSMVLGPPSRATRYIGMDLEETRPGYASFTPDLLWNGRVIPLPQASVDAVLLTEVLEHCPNPSEILAELFRVLRPGGRAFVTVPFLWPLHDVPYDEYRYTPYALQRLLREAGFTLSEVHAHGGWDASLGQMIGLWVSRRPMNANARRVLRRLALPVCRRLFKSDTILPLDRSSMITGMWAIAGKPHD